MSNDIYEFLVGKERFEKEKRFKEELEIIEEEYSDFFKSRSPKSKLDKHDRLYNHYILVGNNNILKFGFENESELPQDLILKCHKAFDKIFKEK